MRRVPGFDASDSRLLKAIGTIWNDYEAKEMFDQADVDELFLNLNNALSGQVLSQKAVTYLFEYARCGTDLEEWLRATHWHQFTPEQKFDTIEFNPYIDPQSHGFPILEFLTLSRFRQESILALHPHYLRISAAQFESATVEQKAAIYSIITFIVEKTGKSFHEIVRDA